MKTLLTFVRATRWSTRRRVIQRTLSAYLTYVSTSKEKFGTNLWTLDEWKVRMDGVGLELFSDAARNRDSDPLRVCYTHTHTPQRNYWLRSTTGEAGEHIKICTSYHFLRVEKSPSHLFTASRYWKASGLIIECTKRNGNENVIGWQTDQAFCIPGVAPERGCCLCRSASRGGAQHF